MFDVTKFTYNMYSYDTCFISREMMEMDGLDSAKWQKSRGRDINGILGKFNEEDDKIVYSGHLLSRPRSRSDPIGESEPVSGCETICWDSLFIYLFIFQS